MNNMAGVVGERWDICSCRMLSTSGHPRNCSTSYQLFGGENPGKRTAKQNQNLTANLIHSWFIYSYAISAPLDTPDTRLFWWLEFFTRATVWVFFTEALMPKIQEIQRRWVNKVEDDDAT